MRGGGWETCFGNSNVFFNAATKKCGGGNSISRTSSHSYKIMPENIFTFYSPLEDREGSIEQNVVVENNAQVERLAC